MDSFHPVYVAPYYGLLMNANFVYEPPENIPGLFNGLKKIAQELDNAQLPKGFIPLAPSESGCVDYRAM